MKKLMTIAALLMAVLLVCSCGGSGGAGENESAPVKVSFILDTPNSDFAKIASVDNTGATYDYYYAAIPQWTGFDFTTIQGYTGGTDANPTYVKLNSYTPGTEGTLGLFAQGSWKFYAKVSIHRTNESDTEVIVYEGSTGVEYINASNTSVTIDVTRKANAGTATVSIDIEVPKLSASGTGLTVSYTDGTTPGTVSNIVNTATPTKTGNWVRFTGSTSALQAGSYTFTLTSKEGSNEVGGAVLAFDLIPGEDRTISGTIENGVWQTTLLTINVPTLTVTLSSAATNAQTGLTSVVKNTDTTFTCTATATQLAEGDTVLYQWYVNTTADGNAAAGTATQTAGQTTSTYTFNQSAPGYYYVTCKASVAGKLIASKTMGIVVTNN